MTLVRLETFEDYREILFNYSKSLLRSRVRGFLGDEELVERAKDMVQDTYLVFHRHHKLPFPTEDHLKYYLKACLFNQYRISVDPRFRSRQHILIRAKDISKLKWCEHPKYEANYEIMNFIGTSKSDVFRKYFTARELSIIDASREDLNRSEMSKQLNTSVWTIRRDLNNIRNKIKRLLC